MPGVAEETIERLGILKGQRTNFDTTWQEIVELMNPFGGDFQTKRSPGEQRTENMFEMTAANALEKFTAAMEAFHTPRNQQWARTRASDEDLNKISAVREFFEEADRALAKMRNSPKARFYGQSYEVYKSLGMTGNGCLFVDEAPTGGARYRFTHVGQTWVETSFEGVVDTVYYEYELTARAAVQKWGDKAPAIAKSAVGTSPLQKNRYLHVVRPNQDRDRDSRGPSGKPFESLEISVEDRELIDKSGYEELPYIWTRYTVNPAEVYGRGPAMLVLPDVKTLQQMQKTFLRAGHKVADPPLLAASDNQLGRGSKKIRINPGGITWGGMDKDGRAMIAPLVTGARIDMTEGMMDKLRENIREAFLNDFFEMLVQDRVQMTAFEVAERAKEKGQLLAPIIGRQQSEFLGPLVAREMGIAQRQGLLPPMPPELIEAEGEYEIEYESDATRMQRSDEVSAFLRLQELMTVFIQTDPTVLDKIDAMEAMEHYGHDLGVPQKIFRAEDEVEAMQAQRAQAAQAQQAAEQLPGIAKGVRDLSEVDAA